MNPNKLRGLDEEGLRKVISYLDREIQRAGFYEELKITPAGEFLIHELKDRVELAHNLYKNIEPHHENARYMLATIQAYEREAQEWLSRIDSCKQFKENVAEDIDMIKKMVRNKKDRKKRQDTKFTVKDEENKNG